MAVQDPIAVADGDENIRSAGKDRRPLFDGTVFGDFQYPAVQVHLPISVDTASYGGLFVFLSTFLSG